MPVIKSAKKKLRQDARRTLLRSKVEQVVKDAVKTAKANPSVQALSKAASLLDKAAKKHIIHANKAARIKSRLAHVLNPKSAAKTAPDVKTTKKSAKKVSKKTK